jgi:O-antigen ligase
VSYWVPWVAPFDDLVFRNGVRQLHAHNAWVDLWLQLGILGLIVFGALVLSTAVRSWFMAVDRTELGAREPGRYVWITVLPILLLVLLVVQSLAESRLLIEYGLTLLVVIAVKTKAAERQTATLDR